MVVITLEKCPISLRGDLTKWLQEISLGVYVGQVSARVRDRLWERICEESKSGRATMVFSTRNEQRFDFRVHNTIWRPVDFDGLKLMMRPSITEARKYRKGAAGSSDVSRRLRMNRSAKGRSKGEPAAYVVVDVETTGLDPKDDQIIEIAGLKIVDGDEVGSFQRLVIPDKELSCEIERLTGLTDARLRKEGEELSAVLKGFLDFTGLMPVMAHNASFDCEFIQVACEECDLDDFDNECIDTLDLARKKLPRAPGYRLTELAAKFAIDDGGAHRALTDCRITRQLFLKLIEM